MNLPSTCWVAYRPWLAGQPGLIILDFNSLRIDRVKSASVTGPFRKRGRRKGLVHTTCACVVNHREFRWSYLSWITSAYSCTLSHKPSYITLTRNYTCTVFIITWAPRGLLEQQHRIRMDSSKYWHMHWLYVLGPFLSACAINPAPSPQRAWARG